MSMLGREEGGGHVRAEVPRPLPRMEDQTESPPPLPPRMAALSAVHRRRTTRMLLLPRVQLRSGLRRRPARRLPARRTRRRGWRMSSCAQQYPLFVPSGVALALVDLAQAVRHALLRKVVEPGVVEEGIVLEAEAPGACGSGCRRSPSPARRAGPSGTATTRAQRVDQRRLLPDAAHVDPQAQVGSGGGVRVESASAILRATEPSSCPLMFRATSTSGLRELLPQHVRLLPRDLRRGQRPRLGAAAPAAALTMGARREAPVASAGRAPWPAPPPRPAAPSTRLRTPRQLSVGLAVLAISSRCRRAGAVLVALPARRGEGRRRRRRAAARRRSSGTAPSTAAHSAAASRTCRMWLIAPPSRRQEPERVCGSASRERRLDLPAVPRRPTTWMSATHGQER